MTPDDPRHGTRPGYYAHRRDGEDACEPCKRAAARKEQERQLKLMRGMPGRIDATGTRRRLQALTCLGWNWTALGALLDSDPVMVKRWAERDDPGTYVFAETHSRVAEVYERLCMTPAPTRTPMEKNHASRARGRALRHGWAPPLAWDDIDRDEAPRLGYIGQQNAVDRVVVERILGGQRHACTQAERREVVSRWLESGRPLVELERLTGWNVSREVRGVRQDGAA